MKTIHIKTTKPKEVINITNLINENLEKESGVCNVFVTHTTCCLTTADLDPGTDQDLLDAIEKMFPEGNYRHPHDPSHVGEHIMSSMIGPSITVPIENGKLKLGTWQEVVLIELSGPKDREIVINEI